MNEHDAVQFTYNITVTAIEPLWEIVILSGLAFEHLAETLKKFSMKLSRLTDGNTEPSFWNTSKALRYSHLKP